ncbi:hypothetical protein ONZ51_g6280 [Trametes cubensis]|uniref:Uncharacterized protein n=1 Tax=Trametes cubensis TaxID=1111947 RepID=A0AAD7XB88_9APHY|nr:hypothetical protein ONZ51_g6280 [Trametes cubensis]
MGPEDPRLGNLRGRSEADQLLLRERVHSFARLSLLAQHPSSLGTRPHTTRNTRGSRTERTIGGDTVVDLGESVAHCKSSDVGIAAARSARRAQQAASASAVVHNVYLTAPTQRRLQADNSIQKPPPMLT